MIEVFLVPWCAANFARDNTTAIRGCVRELHHVGESILVGTSRYNIANKWQWQAPDYPQDRWVLGMMHGLEYAS